MGKGMVEVALKGEEDRKVRRISGYPSLGWPLSRATTQGYFDGKADNVLGKGGAGSADQSMEVEFHL
jgi:hypothetical protein